MFTKLKITASLIAVLAASSASANEKINDARVYDHTKIIYKQVPTNQTFCKDVKVPVYGTVQKQGDAAGGALAGMIIGGLLGKGVSGNDDGAAAGAVIGGLIGADKGSKPKNSQEVIGYEYVEKCNTETIIKEVKTEVYSHSTIRFYIDGKKYVLKFVK
jgi:uncharacterized protein YcfJ